MSFSRRDFLKIMGASGLLAHPLVSGAFHRQRPANMHAATFKGISPDFQDRLKVCDGMEWHHFLKSGDALGKDLSFGDNNDHLQFFPLSSDTHGILWVNHEYYNPLFFAASPRTRESLNQEMDLVGGSLVEIKKENGKWQKVAGSAYNRRLTARTVIPFAWDQPIVGKREAIGTFANCAGGKTPWGSVLTCEENYDMFYGERDRATGTQTPSTYYGWEKFVDYPPEHYGWVVEVNPKTGEAKKLVSLGRFAHEAATVRVAGDGRCVVYSGDDTVDQFIYKFIAAEKGSLERGTLYVANTEKGQWIPLVHSDSRLKKVFKDQTEIQINCREAGKLVGATPQDRPEDIEVDPFNGDVLVACTNNTKAGRPHGKILKIKERGNDPLSLSFKTEVFLAGGEESGFSCPDNMAFDKRGNLWFTVDIAGDAMSKPFYQNFGNNGIFVVMREGAQKGIPVQVASAPMDAEFTGPLFSPDYKTLFVCVQHPGELSKDKNRPTSHWPEGGTPRSAVVAIQGPLLERITLG